jgi:Ca2+-binding RTX toxin-like protein
VNVNAGAQLTVSAFTATGITTLDASGSTATTSLNVAANVSANDFTYTGGSGNDTLIANSGFGGLDSLDGGEGSNTLSIRPLATSGDVTVGALVLVVS